MAKINHLSSKLECQTASTTTFTENALPNFYERMNILTEKSEHKSPWQLAVEQLIGVFFIAMLIALGLDDPEHECLFAALKYTAAIYLFTWACKTSIRN